MAAMMDSVKRLVSWQSILLLCLVTNFIGIIFVVGGLSSAVVYCQSEPGTTALLNGFDIEDRGYALTRLTNFGYFTCGAYWRFQWTVWGLQVVWFILFTAAWYWNMLAQFLPGFGCFGAAICAWHMWNADDLVNLYGKTHGQLWDAGIVAFLGTVALMISVFSAVFVGGALVHQQAAHRALQLGQASVQSTSNALYTKAAPMDNANDRVAVSAV